MSARGIFLVLLAVAFPVPARPQSPPVPQVVRWENGRGLTVLLGPELADPDTPADLRGWSLVEREGGSVPLATASALDPLRCTFSPDAPGPTNRICVPLDDAAPPLGRDRRYVLFTDSIRTWNAVLPPAALEVPPVRGGVKAIDQRTRFVEADYPVDLSRNPSVTPRVRVNRREAVIVTAPVAGIPLCYRRGGLDFVCEIDRTIGRGDTVDVDLVHADGTAYDTTLTPAVAKVAPPDSSDYLSLAYSRLKGEGNGTLTFKLQDFWRARLGRLTGPVEVGLSLFADVLVTSKTDGSGRYTVGPMVQTYVDGLPLLDPLDLRLVPRWEADDGNLLGNLMYADVQARLYLPGLAAHGLPRQGSFRFIPRGGLQAGTTVRGADSLRREVDDPRRIMAGAEAVLSWPEGKLAFAPAGLRITADAVAHFIRRDAAFPTPSTGQPFFWTASATYKVAPGFGFTLTRRSGRLPPLFKHQSALEFGATFLM